MCSVLATPGKPCASSIAEPAPRVQRRPEYANSTPTSTVFMPNCWNPSTAEMVQIAAATSPSEDHSARRTIGAMRFRLVSSQQPYRHVGQTNADEIGEVGGRHEPDRVPKQQEEDGHAGRKAGRHPGHVRARPLLQHSWQQAILGELRHRPRRAGERLQRAVEHVEHHEPDGSGLGEAAEYGRKCGAEHQHEVLTQLLGTQHAQPDDRQRDEVDRRHRGAGEHGARHILVGIDGFPDMAGGRLESGRRESDQIESRHEAGQFAEPT